MKTLKFRPYLIPSILSGEKNSTWRIFDDKDLQKDEEVLFLNWETKKPFAKAVLTEVFEKPLNKLTDEEKGGHEEYASDEEMLSILSTYYKTNVTLNTPAKIIRFRLIEKL